MGSPGQPSEMIYIFGINFNGSPTFRCPVSIADLFCLFIKMYGSFMNSVRACGTLKASDLSGEKMVRILSKDPG